MIVLDASVIINSLLPTMGDRYIIEEFERILKRIEEMSGV